MLDLEEGKEGAIGDHKGAFLRREGPLPDDAREVIPKQDASLMQLEA